MFWQIFKKLNFKEFFGLLWLFLKNPVYAFPTIIATQRCMKIASKEYGSKHHLSNKANAFRHTLWVILIAKRCLKWRKNEAKATAWAKAFTDWHEDFSPNRPLERAMDLHNNKVGVFLFDEIKHKSEAEIVSILKQKASEALKIESVEEVGNVESKLVYIAD